MIESAAVERMVYDKLRLDADLIPLISDRIYPGAAPQRAALPFVVTIFRSARNAVPLNDNAAYRIHSTVLYIIKVVTQEGDTFDTADEIMHHVDEALSGAEAAVTLFGTTYNLRCATKEDDVRYIEQIGDTRFNHVGGVYVFSVSPP